MNERDKQSEDKSDAQSKRKARDCREALESNDKKGKTAMTKKDIPLLIEGLRRISNDFTELADELEGKTSKKDTETEAAPAEIATVQEPVETAASMEPETPSYTFADVRKILADKSRKGYTDKVKAIITAHQAERLSDIPKSEYAAVVAEAEALDG